MERKGFVYLILPVLLMLLLPACTGSFDGQTPEPPPEPASAVETPRRDLTELVEKGLVEVPLPTRTPLPAATPDIIQEAVASAAERVGLDGVSFLGLSATDWIDLGVSLLIVLVGYLIGTWVIRRLLPRIVRRTPTEFDDRLLAIVGSDIRWLVVLFVFQYAILRLLFVRAQVSAALIDLIFVVELIIVLRIVWRLITFAEQWFTEHAVEVDRGQELTPVIKLLVILSRVFGLTIGLSILLSHFGVDVTLLAVTLGIGGLALSLGARSLFADLVAGITILLDRPFRIGDRIEIEAKETWGDVIDIGLRSTRIRTPDNRVVIVPNSNIAQNEVVNYSYPDPVYRYQTHVGVAYGTDIETARRVIIEAMQQLEEVLPDRPVDALYVEMGDSSIVFRVRWWMGSYVDTRHILDRVHTSIHAAFDAAGIQIPFPQRDLHLDIVPETVGQLSKAINDGKQPASTGQANERSADS